MNDIAMIVCRDNIVHAFEVLGRSASGAALCGRRLVAQDPPREPTDEDDVCGRCAEAIERRVGVAIGD